MKIGLLTNRTEISAGLYLKDILHRCDRAMIYVFIAGSYFPWLTLEQLPDESWASQMKWIVWLLAILGIMYQQIFHEKYKRLETIFYVVMGVGPVLLILNELFICVQCLLCCDLNS
ncbi:hypothetical protein NQ315_016680 [Exocentrus adspersus]|uniref:Uncharacterized protein n=1 Tax=Exocentrus adspersus TaxID=1586481 RepID=A0AAV8VPH0_9CUCU|nr:hypothetical protein NQ315_016680 [Exocentrus adspersus]